MDISEAEIGTMDRRTSGKGGPVPCRPVRGTYPARGAGRPRRSPRGVNGGLLSGKGTFVLKKNAPSSHCTNWPAHQENPFEQFWMKNKSHLLKDG